MLISEIFYSIQGEGELVGVPSVFVRTSGCNLRCRWCDTPYASWNPDGEEMSLAAIMDAVASHPAKHVVLTGGEPMVAKGIRGLAAALRGAGYHITIETAGTVPPDGIACDLASLSPKLAHSTPLPDRFGEGWTARHDALRLQPAILADWVASYPCQVKFVVSGPGDLAEIEALLVATGAAIPPHRVLLMPEGTCPEEIRARSGAIVRDCMEKGYRYCDRLHITLFGNRRGT